MDLVRESFAFSGGTVDETGPYPVIRGVHLCGLTSEHGYDYSPAVWADDAVLRQYEGADSYEGHKDGPRLPTEKVGVFRNARRRADGTPEADYHLEPDHPLTPRLIRAAKHDPSRFSFSHQAHVGRWGTRNGKRVIEALRKVHCVDVVSRGGTTGGIFEGAPDASGHVHGQDGRFAATASADAAGDKAKTASRQAEAARQSGSRHEHRAHDDAAAAHHEAHGLHRAAADQHAAAGDVKAARTHQRKAAEHARSRDEHKRLAGSARTFYGIREGGTVPTVKEYADKLAGKCSVEQLLRLKSLVKEDGYAAAPMGADAPAPDAADTTADAGIDSAFLSAAVAEIEECMDAKGDPAKLKRCLGRLKKLLMTHGELSADDVGDEDEPDEEDEPDKTAEGAKKPKKKGKVAEVAPGPDPWELVKECQAEQFTASPSQLLALKGIPEKADRTAFIREQKGLAAATRPRSAARDGGDGSGVSESGTGSGGQKSGVEEARERARAHARVNQGLPPEKK